MHTNEHESGGRKRALDVTLTGGYFMIAVKPEKGFLRSFFIRVYSYAITIGVIAFCCSGCSSTRQSPSNDSLLLPLRPYVDEVATELDLLSNERKVVLNEIAARIAVQLQAGKEAKLTFICTHNSRRSHMSQIWAQTAAYYYDLDRVYAFSGGTQVTDCNCRTVAAMRRVGFSITDATAGANPLYLVSYADDRAPIRAYSKLYNADANPKSDFIALMTCSSADKSCPVVKGAIARYAIHYADPRLCDDTPTETAAYNERCREIAREMFYIMAEVRRRTGQATGVEARATTRGKVEPKLKKLEALADSQ